jgi:vacuolar-type H+-ATPase subunit E/Vma4
MMTTIHDKLKVFADEIISKAEKDSEKEMSETAGKNSTLMEQERANALKEADSIVNDMKKRAEAERAQIIAKADIDRQHAFLVKKKYIFDRVMEDIFSMAEDFTSEAGYAVFLQSSLKEALSRIKGKEVNLFLKSEDIEKYRSMIMETVNKYAAGGMAAAVQKTDMNILGGCICENAQSTRRIDCTLIALIDESKALVGRMLYDNLYNTRQVK